MNTVGVAPVLLRTLSLPTQQLLRQHAATKKNTKDLSDNMLSFSTTCYRSHPSPELDVYQVDDSLSSARNGSSVILCSHAFANCLANHIICSSEGMPALDKVVSILKKLPILRSLATNHKSCATTQRQPPVPRRKFQSLSRAQNKLD